MSKRPFMFDTRRKTTSGPQTKCRVLFAMRIKDHSVNKTVTAETNIGDQAMHTGKEESAKTDASEYIAHKVRKRHKWLLVNPKN